jgi:hypothetical protein
MSPQMAMLRLQLYTAAQTLKGEELVELKSLLDEVLMVVDPAAPDVDDAPAALAAAETEARRVALLASEVSTERDVLHAELLAARAYLAQARAELDQLRAAVRAFAATTGALEVRR